MSEDALPFVSQLKSLIFCLRGDYFGAWETQVAFMCECVLVSQMYSTFLWFTGDSVARTKARRIQAEFVRKTLAAVPLFSQLWSLVLLLCCQWQTAWSVQQSFLSAMTDLLSAPVRLVMYLLHPWPRIVRPLHSVTSAEDCLRTRHWMADFSEFPLSYLTLPGSHNAHAYRFKWIFSFLRNFAQNQHCDIYEQLLRGSRCLDLRLAVTSDGTLHCAHNWCLSVRFDDALRQVAQYIADFPTEVVILRVKAEAAWHSCANNPPLYGDVRAMTEALCGDWLAPGDLRTDQLSEMRVGDFVTRKWNILLFYEYRLNACVLKSSWLFTNSQMAKALAKKLTKWTRSIEDNKARFRQRYMFGYEKEEEEKVKERVFLSGDEIVVGGEMKDAYEDTDSDCYGNDCSLGHSSTSSVECYSEFECEPETVNGNGNDTEELKVKAKSGIILGKKRLKRESYTLYLANAQTTARMSCSYVLHQVMHGMFGTRSDVEFVNAQLMKRLDKDLIHKVNVIEMDFLHPLFVEKVIDVNRFYCGLRQSQLCAAIRLNEDSGIGYDQCDVVCCE